MPCSPPPARLLTLAVLLTPPGAMAEWRCDCTTIVDTCTAAVEVAPNFIEVSAGGAECARVDYFVDGLPFVTVVAEGTGREDWISRTVEPRVLIQSCQVCLDNADTATPAMAAQPTAASPESLTPIVAPEPAYPAAAQEQGINGNVAVEFTVTPFGTTENIRVVAAEPPGIFDMAAVSAVSRRRYTSDPEREPVDLTETLVFSIEDFIFGLGTQSAGRTEANSGTRRGPRNNCIRERSRYDFGNMIEISLMSTCTDPLVLFTCAVGTGAESGRWNCAAAQNRDVLLVPPGDSRLGGALGLTRGNRTLQAAFEDAYFLMRAPNSEYWWVACPATDEDCGDAAQRWVRALDRQPASTDPQQRSEITVGRSF